MRRAVLLPLILLIPGIVFADEVFLKDAGSISGRIVEQNETTVKVDIGDGFIAVPMARVDRIVKGKSPLDVYADRAAKLGAQDVDGWRTLGDWAANEGFPAQARQAYQKVIAIAPNDAGARKALGYVSVDGKWLTQEEGYRAKGYVKYDGEWMSASEAQAVQSAYAADRAQRDADAKANVAENTAIQEQTRKEKADEDERRRKENYDKLNPPVYWGGYGYGVNTWPSFSSPNP
jgi:hypothetical protein